jgi:hypothetical protein
LRLYLGWKRWHKLELPVLPFTGGWADWDLEETVAIEIIEDLIEIENRRKTFIDDMKKQGPAGFANQGQ